MQIISVLSVAYSGSTLTDLMLSNTPSAFGCGEIHAMFLPWRHHHFDPSRRCFCDDPTCDFWPKLQRQANHAGAHRAIAAATGAETLVDSIKRLDWIADAPRWNPDATIRALVVIKRPEQLAASRLKRGLDPEWDYYAEYHQHILDLGIPFVTIAFDDLVSRPADVIRRARQLAGMPYAPGDENIEGVVSHQADGSVRVRTTGRTNVDPEERFATADVDVPAHATAAYLAMTARNVMEADEWPALPQGYRPPLHSWYLKARGRRPIARMRLRSALGRRIVGTAQPRESDIQW